MNEEEQDDTSTDVQEEELPHGPIWFGAGPPPGPGPYGNGTDPFVFWW